MYDEHRGPPRDTSRVYYRLSLRDKENLSALEGRLKIAQGFNLGRWCAERTLHGYTTEKGIVNFCISQMESDQEPGLRL
jgi:hypothetical protein